MSFLEALKAWPEGKISAIIAKARTAEVDRALATETRTPEHLCALLSSAAAGRLEEMARLAASLTRRQFGRVVGLYAPLYLSNVCHADCLYCSCAVNSGLGRDRTTLSETDIRRECEALARHGFRNVLLLTGEAPEAAPPEYVAHAVKIAHERFPAVGVEVYAMDEASYRALVANGLESVTLYMETYHRPTYLAVHPAGQKRDFEFRLEAIERAGRAGVRRLSIGALLGLHDWRVDGFLTALHARHLQKSCWRSAVGVSFPRLRHTPERFDVPAPVSDRDLVQLVLALRLFLPDAGFNLSTREKPELRDRLIPLGVTMMSAGSSTRPGGYSLGGETLAQFRTEDTRSPAEVAAAIARAGYDPVWKDFDAAFAPGADPCE